MATARTKKTSEIDSKHIFSKWVELCHPHLSRTELAEYISEKTDTVITAKKVSDFYHGQRNVTPIIQILIISEYYTELAISEFGISREQSRNINRTIQADFLPN